jgi:hypothetical protein
MTRGKLTNAASIVAQLLDFEIDIFSEIKNEN